MIAEDDTRSRSATDCMLYLDGEGLPEDERGLWQYLAFSAKRYPWKYIQPFKKAAGRPYVRRLIGARIGTRNDASGQPMPRVLQLYDDTLDRSVDVSGDSDGADVLIREAFTKAHRSAFFVFARGSRVELRLIAQRWGRRLIECGYTVDVLMGGSKLKALVVKKDRHRWYLVDWESMSGLPPRYVSAFSSEYGGTTPLAAVDASSVWKASNRLQQTLMEWFGVGLSLTIGSTGLKAAARTLGDNVCKFKPAPMLVSMCRAGAGYRGGMVHGKRYRGPAWLVDINRAYTAALKYPLPWRAAFGRCERNGTERPGIYVCRITGNPRLRPIYVGVWNGTDCEPQWTNGGQSGEFLTVLPSVEIGGIRALGYDVRPGFGMVYARSFSLASFVRKIVQCCEHYGWQSAESRVTKLLGNSLSGKFAAQSTRRDLRLGLTRPGRDWRIFVDETGWPVEDLWEREVTTYQYSQHIEIAADITARVRGQMYELQAETARAGGDVVAVSTDSAALTIEPCNVLALHSSQFGSFKLADADADGIVAGANAYAIGEKAIIPDYPNPQREDVIALFTQYTVDADVERSGAPRPGVPLSWRIRKRITLPATVDQAATLAERTTSSPPASARERSPALAGAP